MTPVLHCVGLPVHAVPALQATQLPVLHTPPGHADPVAVLPVSAHTGVPELQTMLPVLQGFAGVQLVPATQGVHMPTLQTPPVHAVPFILFVPLTHTPLPELQSMTPF